jgi:hypothetical protein
MDFIIEKATTFWAEMTVWTAVSGLLIFVVTFGMSILLVGFVIVKLPANYFSSHYTSDFLPDSPWLVRWGAVIGKNLLGVFLVALGIVLSVPGVPGQGLLTILLGLIMLDIPGKRPLEARIIQRPAVLANVNALRAKYGKDPLVMD